MEKPDCAVIQLQPLYQERVWGGRMLQSRYGRPLPEDGRPYGESWEVVDRADEQSVVVGGRYAGLTLNQLWREHREDIFGAEAPQGERFPLLIKLLDARDVLSLQVHPPAGEAAALQGEPKTEMWVIAGAAPGACVYAGVQPGTTRELFAAALADGSAAGLVPQLPVAEGDFIFIPSGRLHAIGAGLLIFEIQQNSDTTYRVFDWNRLGLDGQPRAMHVAESLRCIDFADSAPSCGVEAVDGLLVECAYFAVHRREAAPGALRGCGRAGQFLMVGMVAGTAAFGDVRLGPGDWALLPSGAVGAEREATAGAEGAQWLEVGFGGAGGT